MTITGMALGFGPILLAGGFLLCPLAMIASGATCTPDIILMNGRVHTVDPAKPEVEAVAICGDRIAQVGTSAEVRALAAKQTRAEKAFSSAPSTAMLIPSPAVIRSLLTMIFCPETSPARLIPARETRVLPLRASVTPFPAAATLA